MGSKRKYFGICLRGSTRVVFLVGNYAVKIPRVDYGFKYFLLGLVANINERRWWREFPQKELCRVVFSCQFGLFVVMDRADPMTRSQFDNTDLDKWCDRGDWVVPAEIKIDSFGFVDGNLVAVDYGN